MRPIKNNFKYQIVRYYLDKIIVEITPLGVTPTNIKEYPMYITRLREETFKEIVNDLSTF